MTEMISSGRAPTPWRCEFQTISRNPVCKHNLLLSGPVLSSWGREVHVGVRISCREEQAWKNAPQVATGTPALPRFASRSVTIENFWNFQFFGLRKFWSEIGPNGARTDRFGAVFDRFYVNSLSILFLKYSASRLSVAIICNSYNPHQNLKSTTSHWTEFKWAFNEMRFCCYWS